jgi:hypothetical protein
MSYAQLEGDKEEKSKKKLELFENKYEEYKIEAGTIIKNYCG